MRERHCPQEPHGAGLARRSIIMIAVIYGVFCHCPKYFRFSDSSLSITPETGTTIMVSLMKKLSLRGGAGRFK